MWASMHKIHTWDDIAKDYLKIAKTDKFIHYLDSPKFVQLLGSIKGKEVLDLGCGDGFMANMLIKKGAKSYLGVDFSKQMIMAAKSYENAKTRFIVGDVDKNFDFCARAYDVILAKMLLMYVNDPGSFLKRVREVMEKNSILAVSVLHPSRPLVSGTLGKKTKYSEGKYYLDDKKGTVSFANKRIVYYYRSLSSYLQLFINAGFTLLASREIVPDKEFVTKYPEEKKKLGVPITIHFLLKKTGE